MMFDAGQSEKLDAEPPAWPYAASGQQVTRRKEGPAVQASDDMTDWAGLMARVRDHQDRAAFAALFRHFAPRVKAFLMKSGAGAALAEECAQDVMATLWQKAHLFDPARASVAIDASGSSGGSSGGSGSGKGSSGSSSSSGGSSGASSSGSSSSSDGQGRGRGRSGDDGASTSAANSGGRSHAEDGGHRRGADDSAGDARRGRGADDSAGDARRGRGADDSAGDTRRGRGADDGPNHR